MIITIKNIKKEIVVEGKINLLSLLDITRYIKNPELWTIVSGKKEEDVYFGEHEFEYLKHINNI